MFESMNDLYTCSKHNYTGMNQPCPDCDKRLLTAEALLERAKVFVEHFDGDDIYAQLDPNEVVSEAEQWLADYLASKK